MTQLNEPCSVAQQHDDWMKVTATAVNQLHRVDGYKGAAQGALIRPQPAPGKKR